MGKFSYKDSELYVHKRVSLGAQKGKFMRWKVHKMVTFTIIYVHKAHFLPNNLFFSLSKACRMMCRN